MENEKFVMLVGLLIKVSQKWEFYNLAEKNNDKIQEPSNKSLQALKLFSMVEILPNFQALENNHIPMNEPFDTCYYFKFHCCSTDLVGETFYLGKHSSLLLKTYNVQN